MMREGDEAFQRLYNDHYKRVVNYLLNIGVPKEEAREIAQDAFLRVYDSMDRVVGSPVAVVYTAARNLAINRDRDLHAKKRDGVKVALDDVDAMSSAPSAEAAIIDQERRELVKTAIASLPDGMRQALLLRLKDHSYKEIAEILRISIDAVKSRLHDATSTLRERFAEPPPGDDAESDRDG